MTKCIAPEGEGIGERLARHFKQIARLSPKPKQQLLPIIDTFIAAEHTHGNGRAP